LLETLIAIAISLVVTMALTASIGQVLAVNGSSVARENVIKQVENAVQYISRDAVQAQTVTPTAGRFPLALGWTSWGNDNHVTTYYFSGTDLLRREIVNSGQPTILKVANNIDASPSMTNCSFSGGIITVKLTSTVGGFRPASETRIFQVEARSYR
jgi:hypothetical protein